MGHGAPRDLGGNEAELPELPAELSTKLTFALDKLDSLDATFKEARDDERAMQLVKNWNGTCKEIEANLRLAARVLITSHQLSLEIGSDGGGKNTEPWVEESNNAIAKLKIKLNAQNGTVTAHSGQNIVLETHINKVDFDWVLRAMVEWAVGAVRRKTAT